MSINIESLKEGLKSINQDKEVKNVQEQLILSQIEHKAKENFLKSVDTLKGKEGVILKEKFSELDSLVEVLAKSNLNGLIVTGTGGTGKTYKVLKKLGELNSDMAYFSCFSTPLELYHTLYENNGKIILIDDSEGILDNIKTISILKSALWSVTGTRILNYKSTSELLKAPKQFEFFGKLIIITNKIGNDINLKALISRVLFCELSFSYLQILEMMKEIAQNEYEGLNLEQRNEVIDYISTFFSLYY